MKWNKKMTTEENAKVNENSEENLNEAAENQTVDVSDSNIAEETTVIEDFSKEQDQNAENAPVDDKKDTDENNSDLLKELEEEKKRSSDYLDQIKRLNAEFDNFRKREEKSRLSLKGIITENMIQDFLPVIDNFERALACADNENTNLESFVEGMKMVYSQSEEFLRSSNVKKMKALGEIFDPNLHDAVSKMASEDYAEDTVMQVMQNGWYLGEKVIRHAMVVVSDGAADKNAETDNEENNGES